MRMDPGRLTKRDLDSIVGIRLGIEHTIPHATYDLLFLDAKERGCDVVDIYLEIMLAALMEYTRRRIEERSRLSRPEPKEAKTRKRTQKTGTAGSPEMVPGGVESSGSGIVEPQMSEFAQSDDPPRGGGEIAQTPTLVGVQTPAQGGAAELPGVVTPALGPVVPAGPGKRAKKAAANSKHPEIPVAPVKQVPVKLVKKAVPGKEPAPPTPPAESSEQAEPKEVKGQRGIRRKRVYLEPSPSKKKTPKKRGRPIGSSSKSPKKSASAKATSKRPRRTLN